MSSIYYVLFVILLMWNIFNLKVKFIFSGKVFFLFHLTVIYLLYEALYYTQSSAYYGLGNLKHSDISQNDNCIN